MAKKNPEADSAAPKLYTSLRREASAEFVEKKSRFIGYAKPVSAEEEAMEFIKSIRIKHADATHNVYAYLLRGGAVARCSDDGEPQGTAGIPLLDVIKKSGADDCVVVVTRYFGGTLLGAGGLIRAYTNGGKIAIEAAEIVTYENHTEFKLKCDYSAYQRIVNELPKFGVITDSTDFGGEITLKLAVKTAQFEEFASRLAEMFAGRIIPEITGERFDCL